MGQLEEGRTTLLRVAQRQARTASRGERDFRKARADGVSKKDEDGEDEAEDKDKPEEEELKEVEGEMERFPEEARVSSVEQSVDSWELSSEQREGGRSRMRLCLWACAWSSAAIRAGLKAPPSSLSLRLKLSQRGSGSQQCWTITCSTLRPKPSCCSRDDNLQTQKKQTALY